jgi:hypothetical protein
MIAASAPLKLQSGDYLLDFLYYYFGVVFLRMAGTINLYSIGLNYASATSSSAIFNIVPVVAFILAVMFRSGIQTRTMVIYHFLPQ